MATKKTSNGVTIVKDLPVTISGLVQRADSNASPNSPIPVRIITKRDDKTNKHNFTVINVDTDQLTG